MYRFFYGDKNIFLIFSDHWIQDFIQRIILKIERCHLMFAFVLKTSSLSPRNDRNQRNP